MLACLLSYQADSVPGEISRAEAARVLQCAGISQVHSIISCAMTALYPLLNHSALHFATVFCAALCCTTLPCISWTGLSFNVLRVKVFCTGECGLNG